MPYKVVINFIKKVYNSILLLQHRKETIGEKRWIVKSINKLFFQEIEAYT